MENIFAAIIFIVIIGVLQYIYNFTGKLNDIINEEKETK